jgi:hypothetical protein
MMTSQQLAEELKRDEIEMKRRVRSMVRGG